MIAAARARLLEAHDAHAEANAALDAAAHAASSARAFLSGIKQEGDRFAEIDRGISTSRAKELKAALKGGTTPTFAAVPALPRNAAARADAENRLEAAKLAVAELEADERDAELVAKAAKAELAAAVLAVIAAEAHAIALEVERLELVAQDLRARIGGSYSAVDQAGACLAETTKRVISSTDRTDVVVRNMAAWCVAQAANATWKAFASALVTNPAAELNFQTELVAAAKAG